MEIFKVFLKGLWIGGTLTVPGVSGGSMAMVLGVYERLLQSLNGLFKKGANKLECLKFVLTLAAGGSCGVLLISKIIVYLLDAHPLPMIFFFAGAVIGGSRVIFREINTKILSASDVLYPLIGVAIVLSIAALPSDLFDLQKADPLQWIIQLLAGGVAAVALVLPGISISQVLYIFGMYTSLFNHLIRFEFLPLLPFTFGLIGGVILTSHIIEELMFRFRKESYLITLGFVVGSVIQLFKAAPSGHFDLSCVILFIIGFSTIFFVSKKRTQ